MKNTDHNKASLSKAIEETRSVLNELCSDNDCTKNEIRLAVSRYLDELIVEYMTTGKLRKRA